MKKFIICMAVIFVFAAGAGVLSAIVIKGDKKPIVGSCEIIGAGGYGAIFDVAVDPFDDNIFAARCDMGGIYMSYDRGENWTRHNMLGVLFDIEFDEENEGVLWTAGNGLYKSTNHGRTFELVFPSFDTITAHGAAYEGVSEPIYSTGDYLPTAQIKHIAINRKSDGQNVFVAQQDFSDSPKIRIFETKNGKDFQLFTDIELFQNFKMEYDETNDCLIVVTDNKIIEIDKNKQIVWSKEIEIVNKQLGWVFSFDSYFNKNTNTNTFAFSTYVTGKPNVNTALYVTNDLRADVYTDLIPSINELLLKDVIRDPWQEEIDRGLKSNQYLQWVGDGHATQTFPWEVLNVYTANDECIYFYNESSTDIVDSNGIPTGEKGGATAYLQYKKGSLNWVYGSPHFYAYDLQNTSWQDYDSQWCCFGMSSSRQNEDKFVFSTMGTVYYTEDGKNIYQRHCKVGNKVSLTAKDNLGNQETFDKINGWIPLEETTTNGLNVQTTYKTATDPFNKNHLLMACTDFGLLQSFNNGRTWVRSLVTWNNDEIEPMSYLYRNNCYDIEFDKNTPNVVYALWSSDHDMPYGPTIDMLNDTGAFGISYDGGTSWTMRHITDDDKVIPYRMDVEYTKSGVDIYIATYGNGFFVTHDLGETFVEMNEGVKKSTYLGEDHPAIFGNEILCCDDGIYAITAASAWAQITDPENPEEWIYERALYKWNKSLSKFEEILLPKEVACVRDIEYSEKEDCLYIGAIGRTRWDTQLKYGGGVYRYKDGVMKQVFDESKFVWGLALDSKGILYAATFRGEIYRFTQNNTRAELFVGKEDFVGEMFHVLKDITFGASDNIFYVSTFGGGMYRITIKYK